MREEKDASLTGEVGIRSEGILQLNVSSGDPSFKPLNGIRVMWRDVGAVLGGIMSWACGGKTEQKSFSAVVGVDVMSNVMCASLQGPICGVSFCPVMTKLRTSLLPSDVNSMRQ